MTENTRKAIDSAKRHLNDPSLATEILKPLPEVDSLGLRDLVSAMSVDNYVHKSDVLFLIQQIETA